MTAADSAPAIGRKDTRAALLAGKKSQWGVTNKLIKPSLKHILHGWGVSRHPGTWYCLA